MYHRSEQEIMQEWKGDHAKPIVSISNITYNHEKYISEALDGFLMQETNFAFEVLVHDDCSTDNTANIIREYEKKYPNIIKPIYQKENQYSKGITAMSATFNFPRAKGKYIALCEGDDYWTDPLKLQKQVSFLEENPQVSICFHPAEEIDMSTNIRKLISNHFREDTEVSINEVILGRGAYMPTASLIFRNTQMDRLIDSFKDAPVGDYFIQVYKASQGTTYFLKESMSVYRVNTVNSWTNSCYKEKHHKMMHYFKMVEAVDKFSPYLQKAEYRKILYSVLQLYAKMYISYAVGIRGKVKAIDSTASLLQNYNRNKYKIDMYLSLIKNKLFSIYKN